MDKDKDILIASLQKELQQAYKKITVLEDEIALLNYEVERLKRKVEFRKV